MREKTITLILLIAGILGIVEGLLTLIGGLIAAYDSSRDDIPDQYAYHFPVGKYWCGMVRGVASSQCSFSSLDRGWFYRAYTAVQDNVYSYNLADSTTYSVSSDDIKSLTGYEAVMSYAIICGIGWILAGAMAIVGSLLHKSGLAMSAGVVFAVLYGLFVTLFCVVWDSVSRVESDCQAAFDACPEFKSQVTRSSREFLAYSICSFVLVVVAAAGSFFYGYTMVGSEIPPTPEKTLVAMLQDKNSSKGSPVPILIRKISKCEVPLQQTTTSAVKITPLQLDPAEPRHQLTVTQEIEEESKVTDNTRNELVNANTRSDSSMKLREETKEMRTGPPLVVTIQNLYGDRFAKVNKYLFNPERLTRVAEKNFAAMNSDKSGRVSIDQLKLFVSGIMIKKRLPPPADEEVRAFMHKYNKDGSGKMSKDEFREMMKDIFIGSQEELIRKYAESKAEMTARQSRSPVTVADPAGAQKLSMLLKDPIMLYAELDGVRKELGKDKSPTLSVVEVTEVLAKFCGRYNVPTLRKEEVAEITAEVGRPVKDYASDDIRLVALAVLSIVKCLALPK